MQVKFFDYQNFFLSKREAYLSILDEVLSRGAFILQRDLEEFEKNFAAFMKIRHAIGVSDATSGLTLGLRAIGIGPGDEVIFPSHTFIATAGAIKAVGATPVPVDIGWDGLISSESARASITSRTRVILPVQLNGRVCTMDPLLDLAREFGLRIVEDSAQAFGATYRGRYAGSFGEFGAFSFYPAKSLGCFGDGGAVVTNDDALGAKLRVMRDHGRSVEYGIETWGMNSRLDNVQAAILDFKLKTFREDIARRREIASRYEAALHDIDDLILPPAPDSESNHFDTFQNYELQAGQRDRLRSYLGDHGVDTIIQWGGRAVHQFDRLNFGVCLPNTEAFFEKCFMLPMNSLLTDEQVDFVCDCVRSFYSRS